MSDIVERLRGTRVEVSVSPEEAADEIEALRTDNATLRAALKAHGEEAAKLVGYRGLLLWALYHHQGGSSPVGQPIRAALGIGEHDHLTPSQIYEACDSAANAKAKHAKEPE